MASKKTKAKKTVAERLEDFLGEEDGNSIGEIFLGDFSKPGEFGLIRQKDADKSIGLASNREEIGALPNIESADLGDSKAIRKLK